MTELDLGERMAALEVTIIDLRERLINPENGLLNLMQTQLKIMNGSVRDNTVRSQINELKIVTIKAETEKELSYLRDELIKEVSELKVDSIVKISGLESRFPKWNRIWYIALGGMVLIAGLIYALLIATRVIL